MTRENGGAAAHTCDGFGSLGFGKQTALPGRGNGRNDGRLLRLLRHVNTHLAFDYAFIKLPTFPLLRGPSRPRRLSRRRNSACTRDVDSYIFIPLIELSLPERLERSPGGATTAAEVSFIWRIKSRSLKVRIQIAITINWKAMRRGFCQDLSVYGHP